MQCSLLRIAPMQMKNTTKRIQVEHTERVEWLCKKLLVLFSQRSTTQTKSTQRKHKLTELSNVIIYVMRPIAYLNETNEKSYTSGLPDMLHNPSGYPNASHGPNSFRNRTPGDK